MPKCGQGILPYDNLSKTGSAAELGCNWLSASNAPEAVLDFAHLQSAKTCAKSPEI